MPTTPTMYWVADVPSGRIAIVPRPGGGDRLADEVRGWRSVGVDFLVSLLTQPEVTEFALDELAKLCRNNGIEYLPFPIPDRGVPRSVERFRGLIDSLRLRLVRGQTVAVHGRAGIGRSSLVAAGTLAATGVAPGAAFERIANARGCPVPETEEQRAWVEQFARSLRAPAPAH